MLRIRLLGDFELRVDDELARSLDSARAESLLAFLVLHRNAPQLRQRIAFLLWPDSTESQALTNLRHLLHTLRRALPEFEHLVAVSARSLQWRLDAPAIVDLIEFEDAAASATAAANDAAAIRGAIGRYAGDLLTSCYDEWITEERERLRAIHLDLLQRAVELGEREGDSADAIHYAEQLLRHDPLDEAGYRRLMRLHNSSGDRARAVHIYHACTQTLERELGIEPSPETRLLYESLIPDDSRPVDGAHAAGRVGGSVFIGREAEWSVLTRHWRDVEGGRTHFVLVSGEPGVGKTRLMEEFQGWCLRRGATVVVARSYPAEGQLAWGPVIDWLRSDPISARFERLRMEHRIELSRLLPELRGEVPAVVAETEDRKQRLFDALREVLRGSPSPNLLIADDIQWWDRESLQFLHYFLRAEPTAPLLVTATARAGEYDQRDPLGLLVAGLHALDRCTAIELARLTLAETGLLAQKMTERVVNNEEIARLFGETEGSPLFVVEALRAGWPITTGARTWLTPKVQSAIATRLAQLSEPAAELIGLAASIGRAFRIDVLSQASELPETTLVAALDELWRRRIIVERGTETYDFSHDKIREVAYWEQSPARRRRSHLRIARALERCSGSDPAPVSGEIGAHWEYAGEAERAVSWYLKAAEAAEATFAFGEATRLLDRALMLIRARPATRERQIAELEVLTALQTPLWTSEGWASERLAEEQSRTIGLASELGVEPSSPLLRSMAITSLSRRDFSRAVALASQLRDRGQREGDSVSLVEAEYVLGISAFWRGELQSALGHFTVVVDEYRPEHRRRHVVEYGLDPQIICLSRLGNTLWMLGHPGRAIASRDSALVLADQVRHPFSRGTVLAFATILAVEMQDWSSVRRFVSTIEQARNERLILPNRVAGDAFRAFVEVLDGDSTRGIAKIADSLAETRTGDQAPGMRASLVRLLLEACRIAGDAAAGLAAADEALAQRDLDRVWEADTHRLRAALLELTGAPKQEVEAALERSLATARLQGARTLELQALAELVRSRLAHGDQTGALEAKELLRALLPSVAVDVDIPVLQQASDLVERE